METIVNTDDNTNEVPSEETLDADLIDMDTLNAAHAALTQPIVAQVVEQMKALHETVQTPAYLSAIAALRALQTPAMQSAMEALRAQQAMAAQGVFRQIAETIKPNAIAIDAINAQMRALSMQMETFSVASRLAALAPMPDLTALINASLYPYRRRRD
jgi:hypothetical protein